MSELINQKFWEESLSQPDWYLLLNDDLERLEKLAQSTDAATRKTIKETTYSLVEEAVREDRMPMGTNGHDFDSDRKPIDTIVIHHTKNQPGMTLERLNAMQLLRIYGRYYAQPTEEEKHIKGQPVWSGHFYGSQQVFWGYHWLVRSGGEAQRILNDSSVGWHAGNWDVNTRSIGICIDDDLTDKTPSQDIIASVANIINSEYPSVDLANVCGHCDVHSQTECPGSEFKAIWQAKLLSLITKD